MKQTIKETNELIEYSKLNRFDQEKLETPKSIKKGQNPFKKNEGLQEIEPVEGLVEKMSELIDEKNGLIDELTEEKHQLKEEIDFLNEKLQQS